MEAAFVYDRGTVLRCMKAHLGHNRSESMEPIEGLHYLVEDRLSHAGLYRLLELKTKEKVYDPTFSQRAIYVDRETAENPRNYQMVGHTVKQEIHQGVQLLTLHPELTQFYST